MKSIETKISEIRSSIGLFRIKSHEVAEALPQLDEVIDLLRAIEKDAEDLCALAQDSIAPDEFASFFTDLLDTFVALIHSSPSQTTRVH